MMELADLRNVVCLKCGSCARFVTKGPFLAGQQICVLTGMD